MVLEGFQKFFGSEAARPSGYLEKDWNAEEWSRGCYGANATPGTLTRYGSALRAPVGPLHWAGTETARQWIGFMDGAIEAGQRAAAEVLGELGGLPRTEEG